MSRKSYKAAILDLDGVLTRTAIHHARSWKEMFDDFLRRRAEREGVEHAPFDIEEDYLRFVDGKPRLDGVRSFLHSRGIEVPEGTRDDPAEMVTVHGLGARKNDIFLKWLEREPVQTFADAVEQVERWRAQGLATALITSSRNGRRILEAAKLERLFDAVIDGLDSERLGIEGKPAPDIFLQAARELDVEPGDAIVVEDAISGIEAGRAGGFGLVVGVARDGGDRLRKAGADIVVHDLRELGEPGSETDPDGRPIRSDRPSALERIDRITNRPDRPRFALFLDYDGTLTPIVRRPEDAVLPDETRSLLRDLSSRVTVAIVSGRDLANVREMVGLDNLYYAGSHGFDVSGPDEMRMEQEEARKCLPELDAAERELAERLKMIEGAWVERKRFAIAIHFREADDRYTPTIERMVDEVRDAHPGLRKETGKKIFELQPDVRWHKGRAVRWLLEQLDLTGPEVLPVYVGDDVTDENAFRELADDGLGIRVGSPEEGTAAHFFLRDTREMTLFLRALLDRLPEGAGDDE